PNHLATLADIALARLRLKQLGDFWVAVFREIVLGVASIALDQRRIRIVHAGSGQIESDPIVLARSAPEPNAGFDDFELRREMELIELIHEDYRRILVGSQIAR